MILNRQDIKYILMDARRDRREARATLEAAEEWRSRVIKWYEELTDEEYKADAETIEEVFTEAENSYEEAQEVLEALDEAVKAAEAMQEALWKIDRAHNKMRG